jgi:CRP-like cAMP-binding protein
MAMGSVAHPLWEPLNNTSTGADHGRIDPADRADSGNAERGRPPLFSGVPLSDYRKICAASRVKEFARGEMLYAERDSVDVVLLLISGLVKISKIGPSGAEVIIRFGAPGDVLGVLGLLSTGRHLTMAQAFRNCRALAWNTRDFKTLVEHFPVLQQNMIRILSGDLLELEERFREVATQRVAPRVARQLLRLGEQIGRPVAGNGDVEIGLSREDLGQMTGTTLYSVSRLLSAWEACGWVTPHREGVTIRDAHALRAICDEV